MSIHSQILPQSNHLNISALSRLFQSTTNSYKYLFFYFILDCIYSGEILDKNSIYIDHYLSWSFVAHDRLWNLIPTINKINSSKSNNIPSSQYLVKFIQLQHQGLTISYQNLPRKTWLKYTENYLVDLKVNQAEDLLNLDLLNNIYNRHFQPLISLAKIQGFKDNWVY